MKVLVVEDAEDLGALVVMVLEMSGWSVDLAVTGAGALAAVRPDHQVVLVDLGLPDMTGEELVAQLRANADWAAIPVIWFTAQRPGSEPEGAIGVIAKPFNAHSLAQDVERILAQR